MPKRTISVRIDVELLERIDVAIENDALTSLYIDHRLAKRTDAIELGLELLLACVAPLAPPSPRVAGAINPVVVDPERLVIRPERMLPANLRLWLRRSLRDPHLRRKPESEQRLIEAAVELALLVLQQFNRMGFVTTNGYTLSTWAANLAADLGIFPDRPVVRT